MKILYASDIHADFDKLKILADYAKQEKPDMMVIAGDLVNFGLLKQDSIEPISNAYSFQSHQHVFNILMQYAQQHEAGLRRLNNRYDVVRSIPIVAEKIYENPSNEELEGLVEYYLNMLDFAEGNMDIQNDLFKDMMDYTAIEYHMLPGNYDKDLQETKLKNNDLHKKTLEKDELTISGFGGANDFEGGDITPPGVLPELTLPFKEYRDGSGRLVSEAFNFLIKEKPDIAFTHTPPRGVRDFMKDPNTGELTGKGSFGLTEYIKQGFTKLLCCGHMHGAVGADMLKLQDGGAVVLNAGTLKEGYFTEIFINDETKELEKINLYQIKGKLLLPEDMQENLDLNNVKLLMQYVVTKDDTLNKIKLDLNDEHEY